MPVGLLDNCDTAGAVHTPPWRLAHLPEQVIYRDTGRSQGADGASPAPDRGGRCFRTIPGWLLEAQMQANDEKSGPRILKSVEAQQMGYSADKRRRRREHRAAARQLLRNGGFFNGSSAPGSMFWQVAQWHKAQARAIR